MKTAADGPSPPSGTPLVLITGDEVRAALAGREHEVIETVAQAYVLHALGASNLPHSSFLKFSSERDDRIIALPAYLAGRFDVAGVKWVSSFPGNVGRGHARASAVLILNSCADGEAVAVMEGSVVSAQRTAASAVLAAQLALVDRSVTTIGIVGTGLIAAEVVRFLQCVFPPPQRWLLYDLDRSRASGLAAELRRTDDGAEVVITQDVNTVLAGSSLTIFATTAAKPYVQDLGLCPPGAVILHISLRDIAPGAILGCDNLVDDIDHVLRADTSLHLAEQAGAGRDFIRCSLADVLRGRAPPRRDERSVVVFSPFGLGLLDVAVGQFALHTAIAAGHGRQMWNFAPSQANSGPHRVQTSGLQQRDVATSQGPNIGSPVVLANAATTVTTLIDVLQRHAQELSGKRAFTFLENGEDEGPHYTFAGVDRRARAIGARLQQLGVRNERVMLAYPAGLEFVAAFLGCLYAGAIAVPVPASRGLRSRSATLRLRSIVGSCEPKVVLTQREVVRQVRGRLVDIPCLGALVWETTDDIADGRAAEWVRPGIAGSDVALLQYTSGSTADPRGVMVTHANLLHNLDYLRVAMKVDERSIGVCWLPHFHDMGLILGILAGLYVGYPSYLMSHFAFLQRPMRWLEAMHRYRGTVSAAPNFAFDLCVRRTTRDQRAELDLRSWTTLCNGAEPIFAETLKGFVEAFKVSGLAHEALCPGYGLAESTVLVSLDRPGRGLRTVTVDAAGLRSHRAVAAKSETHATQSMVACGRVTHGMEVVIVDPESRRRLAPDRVGEIWLSGPSVAAGYWRLPDATREIFRAQVEGEKNEYLRTGDLGFVHGGDLFLAGRRKDIIILDGANYHPQDIERVAEHSHREVRPGRCIAFSVPIQRVERLVVMVEVQANRHTDPRLDEIRTAIRRAIADTCDLRVHAIHILSAGGIPRTSSGKLQRHACRQAFLDGTVVDKEVLA